MRQRPRYRDDCGGNVVAPIRLDAGISDFWSDQHVRFFVCSIAATIKYSTAN